MAEPRQIIDNATRARMERNRQERKDAIELENIRRYRSRIRETMGDPEGSYEATTPRTMNFAQVPSEVSGSMTMGNLDLSPRPIRQTSLPTSTPTVLTEPAVTMPSASAPNVVLSAPAASAERNEVAAVAANRNAARAAAAARPTTRMRPSASRGSEMSADDLNALSLARGVGADNAPDTAAAANIRRRLAEMEPGMKKGGRVKKMAKGGVVKVSASRRGDGCATKGKTKGRMV